MSKNNPTPINWTNIIHEIKIRRLYESRSTDMKTLTTLGEFSLSTLTRFENNKDIKLSSVIKILKTFGLLDLRQLDFPDKEAHYISERMVISFWGVAQDHTKHTKNIKCEIPHIVLCDPFKVNGKNCMKIFQRNRAILEHEARKKYLANEFEEDESILISQDEWYKTKFWF